MRRLGWLFIMGPALLAAGCGGTSVVPPSPDPADSVVDTAQVGGATQVVAVASLPVLEPDELCEDYSDDVIATFEDANLETAIRSALSLGAQDDLTCGLLRTLTNLTGDRRRGAAGIASLVGIQNLTSLARLDLDYNSVSDISALSGLTDLTALEFYGTRISDISALGGLTSLTYLNLGSNPDLTDIQPLLDNTGLGAGDSVVLTSTSVSCTDVAALEAKGVNVGSDCQ